MSRTTPFAIGHIILTMVAISAVVLMFTPDIILQIDNQFISVGDYVQSADGNRGTVESVDYGMATVRYASGKASKCPVETLVEM